VTIAAPGRTFKAQLEEDEFHMLWLNTPNLVTGKRQGRYLLSAVLKIGWRIVNASPDEQAMLEAHGFRLTTGAVTGGRNKCGSGHGAFSSLSASRSPPSR